MEILLGLAVAEMKGMVFLQEVNMQELQLSRMVSLMNTGLEVRVEDMLGCKLYKYDVGAFDQSYDIRNIDDEIRL